MFCTKCGHILADTDKFCTSCGARVQRGQEETLTWTKVNAPCDHPHDTAELPPVSLGEAVRLYFSRYKDFSGRSRRSEYWGATVAIWVVTLLLTLVLGEESLLVSLWTLATLVPNLAISVRRLHDVGRRWVWLLWNLLPVVGQIILLVALCTDSQKQPNAWGESPKYH